MNKTKKFSYLMLVSFFLIMVSTLSADEVADGKKLFKKKFCSKCHAVNAAQKEKKAKKGPYLVGLSKHRSAKWLNSYLKDPATVRKSDKVLKEAKYKKRMSRPKLTDDQRKVVIKYLQTL